ncbi:MAG TPA: tetratricopeptide repeat protein [Flavobacterium sp.]|jgi:tetratricopeptide (TPR) repeat protein
MKNFFFLITLVLLSNSNLLLAQAEPDDIAVASDSFQDSFFESLKQKGIQNHDRAIQALEKCLQLQPKNSVVLFELGKNYLAQRDYKKAYDSFEKATVIDPLNKWYWNGMYDVSYQTKEYNQSITIIQKLIGFDKSYKEELVALYMTTQQFDKALDLINELNDSAGKSQRRDAFKAQILTDAKYQGSEKTNLVDQIKKYPKEEANYIALISIYTNSNQEDKALETAKQLEKEIPTSDWAQVNVFKSYLNTNDGEKAVITMNRILESNKIDIKIKHRVLNEFLIFAKNNQKYIPDLERAVGYFKEDKNVNVAKEVGKFFQSKKDWSNAITFYELDSKLRTGDIETALLLLESYSQQSQFDQLLKKANALLELFPLQPQLYYYSGLASNQLKDYKKAKEILEAGLDFLVEDKTLEMNFYIQMGEACNGLGDLKNKEIYFQRANKLINNKN